MRLQSVIALACLWALGGAGAANAATFYVSPSGSDSNSGSLASPWKSIAKAQTIAVGGDTVYFRGGTYNYTTALTSCASQTSVVNAILLNKSGSAGNLIRYWAYQSEKPIFNFSGMTSDCRIKGFNVSANYVSLKGLEVKSVPQNNSLNHENWGIWINGDNNVFEMINTHHHMGPGLFISSGGGNLVLNSDSHHNYDLYTSNGAGESADGFGGHPEAGQAVNTFRGCRAWMNSDDGFDLISAYSSVVIENSWAWQNGYIPDTTTPIGNGNGFKMGGYGGDFDPGGVKHTLRFSLAFNNRSAGVYANHHTVANDYYNNTSYNNHPNFNMLSVNSSNVDVAMGKLRNNIAYGGTLYSNMSSDTAYNSWTLPVAVTNNDFNNMGTTGWDAPRQADGSLPVLTSLHLKTGSDLIDKGTNLGFSYNGAAPDLGAFEK